MTVGNLLIFVPCVGETQTAAARAKRAIRLSRWTVSREPSPSGINRYFLPPTLSILRRRGLNQANMRRERRDEQQA
jgi:hypothetical protein